MNDDHGGHVPDDLVYGPVRSRRFGRSLGVSCSPAGIVACNWRCPYCQLGDGPREVHWPEPQRILEALARSLTSTQSDTICVAGAGEPTDHPQFTAIALGVVELAQRHARRSVLLTNGDGLADPGLRVACSGFDACYVKYDPGPVGGAWRSGPRPDLQRLRPLRIQALVYRGPRGSAANSSDEAIGRWLEELAALSIDELQLTTIERPPRLSGLRAVDRRRIEAIADRARSVLKVPVDTA